RHTRFSRDWSSDVCSSDLDGETVAAGEERLEHRAQLGPLEDAGGPATPGAEDAAVAETAAGGEPGEVVQPLPARDQVAHVHVEGAEAGAFERRGHFQLAVDALLAQDRDRRPGSGGDERRGDVLGRVE